jgi:hypothetical protein
MNEIAANRLKAAMRNASNEELDAAEEIGQQAVAIALACPAPDATADVEIEEAVEASARQIARIAIRRVRERIQALEQRK